MTENGITVPDEFAEKAKVYYSANGEATKDLTNNENG